MEKKLKELIEEMKLEASNYERDAMIEEAGYILRTHLAYKAEMLREWIIRLEKILK